MAELNLASLRLLFESDLFNSVEGLKLGSSIFDDDCLRSLDDGLLDVRFESDFFNPAELKLGSSIFEDECLRLLDDGLLDVRFESDLFNLSSVPERLDEGTRFRSEARLERVAFSGPALSSLLERLE